MKHKPLRHPLVQRWRQDYNFKTVTNAAGSTLITAAFAVFNGATGIFYRAPWQLSISVYYLLLAVLRGYIVWSERRAHVTQNGNLRVKAHRVASVLLIVLSLLLAVPVTLLVFFRKPVQMNMIIAITLAAYTTYKIILASVNLSRKRNADSVLVKKLRDINFIDALVSVLVLQSTLIVVQNGADDADMILLTRITSGVIWAATIVIAVCSALRTNRRFAAMATRRRERQTKHYYSNKEIYKPLPSYLFRQTHPAVASLRYGRCRTAFGKTGCGAAAIYNVMKRQGKPQALPDILRDAERLRMPWLFGLFGTKPKSLGRYLDEKGVPYWLTTDADVLRAMLKNADAVIICTWNKPRTGGIHFYTVFNDNGRLTALNRFSDDSATAFAAQDIDRKRLIAGYVFLR